jgi:hypothetical protein
MSLKNRVRRLEEKANMMAIGRGRTVSSRLCTGISSEELLQMIEERLLPESVPVLENIVQQMEEYHQRPPRKLPNGEMIPRIHGFMDWWWGLEAGSSSLPEKIPPELLLAWRNGYANHPAGSTPIPVRRCEDCLLVLPNASPDGFGPSINPCPACGSENISHKKLSGPPCDPMHIYTPINSCGGRWP